MGVLVIVWLTATEDQACSDKRFFCTTSSAFLSTSSVSIRSWRRWVAFAFSGRRALQHFAFATCSELWGATKLRFTRRLAMRLQRSSLLHGSSLVCQPPCSGGMTCSACLAVAVADSTQLQ